MKMFIFTAPCHDAALLFSEAWFGRRLAFCCFSSGEPIIDGQFSVKVWWSFDRLNNYHAIDLIDRLAWKRVVRLFCFVFELGPANRQFFLLRWTIRIDLGCSSRDSWHLSISLCSLDGLMSDMQSSKLLDYNRTPSRNWLVLLLKQVWKGVGWR